MRPSKAVLILAPVLAACLPYGALAAKNDNRTSVSCVLWLGGVAAGRFSECSGIGSENETIEHRVVNEHGVEVVTQLPGRLRYSNIVLKRGLISGNTALWDWRKEIEEGGIASARRNGSVVLLDQNSEPLAQWDFTNAWPSKVTGPTPSAGGSDVGVEELTLAVERWERVH